MKQTAKQVRVRRNPCGMPVDEDFELVEVPLPEPAAGELLVRTIYVSLDPYMRGGMGRPEAIGATPTGGMVSQVLASRSPLFEEGQYVSQYVGGSIGGYLPRSGGRSRGRWHPRGTVLPAHPS